MTITKISPALKTVIGRIIRNEGDDRGWDCVSAVLFESNGILIYKKEYGSNIKISYKQLNVK